jgi:glycosyltransferase involved in cell wall biosynthesis
MRTSVIIAAYSADPYLAESIESVLGQSRPPHEVIVVVDAPTAQTREILGLFGDRITTRIRPKNGAASALNEGIRIASGEALAFQDADDLWLPNKLERQLDVLVTRPAVEAVFGHVKQFVSPDLTRETRRLLTPQREVLPGVSKITMVVRRSAFQRIGFFDESKEIVEFVDWYTRAVGAHLNTVMLPQVVALRRLHLTNTGRVNRLNRDKENLASLKSMLDIKRANRVTFRARK